MIVIADDITGAAEMAGIAHTFGLSTVLTTDGHLIGDPSMAADALVVATDTRSMTAEEAASQCRDLISHVPPGERVFKKVDSALRGHVVEELAAFLSAGPFADAVYLPANPSARRVISGGVCYVDGRLIHETAFAHDPDFPAITSSLSERFPAAKRLPVAIPDATSIDDVAAVVAKTDAGTLLAGAADLFTSWLLWLGYSPHHLRPFKGLPTDDALIVCGSTQSKALSLGVRVAEMPLAVYEDRQTADTWLASLQDCFAREHSLVLTIPYRHLTGKAVSARLRKTMAMVCQSLLAVHRPVEWVIEGGATAYACLHTAGVDRFSVTDVVAPGVIRLSTCQGMSVTLKPGSYPWGGLFAEA